MIPTLLSENDRGLHVWKRGKVRDIYEVARNRLLLVATDRVSAFDVVLPTRIPYKGAVLNRLSAFWFRRFAGTFESHFVTDRLAEMPPDVIEHLAAYARGVRGGCPPLEVHALERPGLEGRAMLCRRARVVPVECVVRGYLAGSAAAEYAATGTIGGTKARAGLGVADELPEALFTPTTKAEHGHDEPIGMAEVEAIAERTAPGRGKALAEELRDRSLALYAAARAHARERGLIICDTKLEWGLDEETGDLLVCDELLTPDSSRYWLAEAYRPGVAQAPLDKQIVRDYLIGIPFGW